MTRTARICCVLLACALFAVSVGAGVVAQQQATEISGAGGTQPTASNQFAILVTTIAGFASLLATHFFQMYRENRTRKWDLADRTAARLEMRQHAETQRLETIQTAIELARVSNINREHLLGAIDKNTKITSEAAGKAEAAYTVATDFQSKIESLHRELIEAAKKGPTETSEPSKVK
jgi:hypothetical protein